MKKIAFITPKDTEFGFLLAGVDQFVTVKEDFISVLKSILPDPDTVLVIIDERLVRDGNEEKMREMEHAWHGILIVLPSPERPVEEIEDYASRLIRRAIGYHVRLKI
jgi:V/A-type H+-transporting ATPase subunit F